MECNKIDDLIEYFEEIKEDATASLEATGEEFFRGYMESTDDTLKKLKSIKERKKWKKQLKQKK